jgi:hypothetical protein
MEGRCMSIIRYCDVCGKEMTNVLGVKEGINDLGRLTAHVSTHKSKFSFQIIVSENSVSNRGDVCKYCILDAFQKLDDRPKADSV